MEKEPLKHTRKKKNKTSYLRGRKEKGRKGRLGLLLWGGIGGLKKDYYLATRAKKKFEKTRREINKKQRIFRSGKKASRGKGK